MISSCTIEEKEGSAVDNLGLARTQLVHLLLMNAENLGAEQEEHQSNGCLNQTHRDAAHRNCEDGGKRHNKHFNDRLQGICVAVVVQGAALGLGVHDAQQGNADGHHTGGPAEDENGALKPEVVEQLASDNKDKAEGGERAQHTQQEDGAGKFHNHGDGDGGYAEAHQVVGDHAADTALHVLVYAVTEGGMVDNRLDNNAKDHGQAHDGQLNVGQILLVPVIEFVAGQSGNERQGQVPGQRVHRHRVDGLFAHGGTLAGGNDAGAAILRQRLGLVHQTGSAFAGRVVDAGDSNKQAGEQAHGGKGLAQNYAVLTAQQVVQRGADGGGVAVSAAVARGHEKGNLREYIGEDGHDQRSAHQQGHAEAQKLRAHIDTEGVAYMGKYLLQAGLLLFAQKQAAEQDTHQHVGVGSNLSAPGDDIQELGSQQQSHDAGQDRGRNIEHLQELDMGAQELGDDQQEGHKREVVQE